MFPVPLVTSSDAFTFSTFWEIVLLYHNRPFLANKLITAVTKVLIYKLERTTNSSDISEVFTNTALLYERRKLNTLSRETITTDFLYNIIQPYDNNIELIKSSEQDFIADTQGTFISIQLLISKKDTNHKVLEVTVLDKVKNSAIFIGAYEHEEDRLTPAFPYEFKLCGLNLKINLQNFEDADTPAAAWLADTLFPKLLRWSQYDPGRKNNITTLSLVAIDEYSIIYSRLKKSYVEGLLKNWYEKTNTDPQKYIHEDLAIASYLICLWRKYLKEDINFVDLGCGNGLLVYILNQEGFKGYGIDIRKRAIWDVYPKETQLKIGTVTPSSVFTDATWLIGNHSDELTPWIPIMALKSSQKTNFFVLPCCPFEFNGEKYIRSNSSLSTYEDYLEYIRSICEKCKFQTEIDKLRIPSTKKVCLVGTNQCTDKETICEIEIFIQSRMKTNFKPRLDVEVVRNCTQLERDLIDKIIKVTVSILLETDNFIKIDNGKLWNCGKSILIAELSEKISSDDLKKLKMQCGGLQTLFRNFRYIFEVARGTVSIRKPTTYEITKEKYRNKPCWFQINHPDGCVNTAENCSYFHK